jgi:hypothetical protein
MNIVGKDVLGVRKGVFLITEMHSDIISVVLTVSRRGEDDRAGQIDTRGEGG